MAKRDPLREAIARLAMTPVVAAPPALVEGSLHLQLFDLPPDSSDTPDQLAAIDAMRWLCAEIPVTRWTNEARQTFITAVRVTCSERLPGLPLLTAGAGCRGQWGTTSGAVWGSFLRLQRAVDAHPGFFDDDAHQLIAAIADGVWMPCTRYVPRGVELGWAWNRVSQQWQQNRRDVRSWTRSRWAGSADLAAGWVEAR